MPALRVDSRLLGSACVLGLAAELVVTYPVDAQRWSLSTDAVVLGKGADELFEWVRFGRLLPDGGAVVADIRGLFIRVYGPNGTRQSQMGRTGSGPGEFRGLYGLWLSRDGHIGAWDGMASRYTYFNTNGEVVSTHSARPHGALPGNLDVFLGTFANGDLLLAALKLERPPMPDEVVEERWFLARFSPDGEFRGSPGYVQGMSRMYRAPLPFSPVPRVAIRQDSIWFIHGYETDLRLLQQAGKPTRSVALRWNRPSEGAAWTVLESELRRLNKSMLLTLLPDAPRPQPLPAAGGLLVDDLGNFWIKEYDPSTDALWLKENALESGPGGIWHVLGPQGAWLATIQFPKNMILLDVRGDRVLGVERDDLDVERVVTRTLTRQ